ncbi:MAG: hypothetical protein GXO84_04500 [Chlorobi bacterium]|nr:hypothetical protein [Chlorobiota bacterium]
MEIENFELIQSTEENRYCVFDSHLEDDDYVFFHMTLAANFDLIISKGFCSAKELRCSGGLESVS